jgi:shikimate dehydrogenase
VTDKYAVIGNPIEHSKSPFIHQTFAKQTNQDLTYEKILAPLDGFADKVFELIALGYKGVNITVPFKLQAFQLATKLSPRAQHAGAVNTLSFNGVDIVGDNTDGAGLVRDIEHNLQIQIAEKRILLIGAGGAAEGVLQPLLTCKPALLVMTNRTLAKAEAMVSKVKAGSDTSVCVCALDDLHAQQFDIVINATSTGLSDGVLPLPPTIFSQNCLAYDMMYGRETPFMRLARSHGARVVDGLGMLVEQAGEAFYGWRGIRPTTPEVIRMIKESA